MNQINIVIEKNKSIKHKISNDLSSNKDTQLLFKVGHINIFLTF